MFKYNADLYRRVTEYPRQVAKDILNEFSHRFKFRPDGQDSLLDIGCGPADITADIILPVLPKQFSRIVGADISESMLAEARSRLQHPNVAFERLDVGKPLDKGVWSKPFDHITSFFCLQFATDERQIFTNIYDLLVDGGDCLLLIMDRLPAYDVVYHLGKSPKWAPYLQDIDALMPYYQFVFDPVGDLEKTMKEIGFSEYSVQYRESHAVNETVNDFKEFYRACLPFLGRFDVEKQDEFLEDFVAGLRRVRVGADASGRLVETYNNLVVFARK